MRGATKIRRFYVAIPMFVLAAVVLPVAIAGAAGGSGKQAAVSKTVKQLQKQVKALQQQIASIQGQPGAPVPQNGPPGASGPAGGDLTGVFPNPTIGIDTVAAPEIQKDAVTAEEIKNDTVGGQEIQSDSIDASDIKAGGVQAEEVDIGAVGVDEIATGGVGASEIGNGAVGARELETITTAVSPNGTAIGGGQFGSAEVTCPDESVLIAGGFAWRDNEASSVVYSAPSESTPRKSWTVGGFVPSGSNVLYAWATCLAL